MHIEIPVLRTPRLVLRGFRAGDLDRLAAISAQRDVMRFPRTGRSDARVEAWQEMAAVLGQWGLRGYGQFAMADGEDAVVGWAGLLHPPDWPEAELAFAVDRPCRGQGLATEAVTAIRDWAFACHPFVRLASFIAPANGGSQRVAAKLGGVREGAAELRGQQVERWLYYRPGSGPVA